MKRDECVLVVSIRYLAIAMAKDTEGIGLPQTMTVDNGLECSDKPVENGYIEGFNGHLRGELPDTEMSCTLTEVKEKLED